MSKYFAWLKDDPTPYDFQFKQMEYGYNFVLNNICIAKIFKYELRSKVTWSCVVQGVLAPEVPRLVDGFATRHDAIGYALKTFHLTKDQYNQ